MGRKFSGMSPAVALFLACTALPMPGWGQDAGALVAIPFRTRVGAYLKSGENTLQIEVTNLSANRIRDLELRKVDWRIMKDVNILSVAYQKFEPDKWPLEESGLLGPVTLTPLMKVSPR